MFLDLSGWGISQSRPQNDSIQLQGSIQNRCISDEGPERQLAETAQRLQRPLEIDRVQGQHVFVTGNQAMAQGD